MKTTLLAVLAVAIGSLSFAATAETPTPEKRAAMKAKVDSMTPEEKAAAKEKAKAKWDAMSPDEQAAAKKKFSEKHPRAAAKAAEKQKDAAAPAK
jgi:hypothetical protein